MNSGASKAVEAVMDAGVEIVEQKHLRRLEFESAENPLLAPAVVEIFPETAAEWLDRPSPWHKRHLHKSVVMCIKDALLQGRWVVNAETIVLTTDGQVVDGQHRLEAAKQTGCILTSLLVTMPEAHARICYPTFDQGASRTRADVFQVEGIEEEKVAAAFGHMAWAHITGHNIFRLPAVGNDVVLSFWNERPDLIEHVHFVMDLDLPRGFTSRSVLAFCSWLFSQTSPTESKDFITRLATGEIIEEGDPVFACRKVLINNIGARKKLSRSWQTLLIVRAWNLQREKHKIKKLLLPKRTVGPLEVL